MSRSTPTRRDQQREDTRRRLFVEAVEVFRRDGVEAARIDEIAQRAGVSRGAFYLYFPAKDDVLAMLLLEAEGEHVARLQALGPEVGIDGFLDAFCDSVAERWQAEPRLFLDVGMMVFRRVSAQVSGMSRDPMRLVLAHRFGAALARGELRSALPPSILADSYLLSVFAAAVAWCGDPSLPLSVVLRGVASLFLYGAATPGGRGAT